MNRQKLRKGLIIFMFALFPLTYYYMSPYLVIEGAAAGIIAGSLILFAGLFVSALFFGRLWCGWLCPGGATQELCAKVQKKGIVTGKKNLVKYAIWIPWLSVIAIMFIEAGGVKTVDPLYQTYYGLSITGIESVVMFAVIAGLIAGLALIAGKRAACHTICWMAPFLILGRKIRNVTNLPALQLEANKNTCVNCKICSKNCPMSLDVNAMVQNGSMENSECILCGVCVDNCPKTAIKYSFSKQSAAV